GAPSQSYARSLSPPIPSQSHRSNWKLVRPVASWQRSCLRRDKPRCVLNDISGSGRDLGVAMIGKRGGDDHAVGDLRSGSARDLRLAVIGTRYCRTVGQGILSTSTTKDA
ncbi:unnamed protein product, partial [Urochloa humidicola]